jgi:hypothetical protein
MFVTRFEPQARAWPAGIGGSSGECAWHLSSDKQALIALCLPSPAHFLGGRIVVVAMLVRPSGILYCALQPQQAVCELGVDGRLYTVDTLDRRASWGLRFLNRDTYYRLNLSDVCSKVAPTLFNMFAFPSLPLQWQCHSEGPGFVHPSPRS